MDTPSYRKINYRVRPAKSIQRKMLCDALLRLSFFEPVENYRYVGFGSTTFTDFILFHKILGIKDMISIEKRDEDKARFEFNNPFDCIRMEYGDSSDVLPSLEWDLKTIVWLDYDGPLTESFLQDIACTSMNLVSGSILVVTVDVEADPPPNPPFTEEEVQNHRLEEFKKRVGNEKVPASVKGKNLEGDEMAATCGKVILNEIEQTLRDRNGLHSPKHPEHKVEYNPLFNFRYQDGAKMLTVGGIFYEARDEANLERCEFENIEFVKSDETFYEIDVPILTHRERLYLDKTLPHGSSDDGKQIGLTEKDINNYKRLYRYFTTFAEIELS
jgi:hypothetical protein